MIESLQNPKIKLARSLQRRRDRERHQLLFLEGSRLVADALESGASPHLLFYTDAAQRDATVHAMIEQHPTVAWQISDPLLRHLTDTVSPQGIAAVVPLPQRPWPEYPSLLLIIDRLRDPGNMGTLLRTAVASGVEGVLLTTGSADPWSDKVLRAGMGAQFRLPLRTRLSWPTLLPWVEELALFVADAGGMRPYDEVDWRQRAALVVGGEAEGASAEGLAAAAEHLRIPMANQVESLNAAIAGGIILFEARRQRRHSGA